MLQIYTLCLLLLGCADQGSDFRRLTDPNAEEDPRTFKGVDEELLPYFEEFATDCNLAVIDIPAGFADIDEGSVVGYCTEYQQDRTYKEITIDRDYWNAVGEGNRHWLVYHELGHCRLNRDHLDRTDKKGNPISIMVSVIPWNAEALWADKKERRYYVSELCGN